MSDTERTPRTGYDADFRARCYDWQRDLVFQAADLDGRGVSDWIRTVLTDVARRRISRHERERSDD